MKDLSFLTSNIIAHRGLHDINKGIPENSMKAFTEAIKNKLLIELDVHVLKDGNVVAFHDNNLKRMTGIDKNIKDMNYEDLANLKLQNTNQNIPLFKDVLKLIDGKVPVIIELKSDVKHFVLEKKVISLLKDYHGKFAVKSFNPFSIRYFKKYCPGMIRGIIISDYKKKRKLINNHLLLLLSKPDFISYDIRASHNRIKRLRKKRLVLGWTIRKQADFINNKEYFDNLICENIDLNNKL